MKQLNDYLVDSKNPESNLFIDSPYLKNGLKFNWRLTYQFGEKFNFGIFANYQTSQVSISQNYKIYDPIEDTYFDYSYDFVLTPKSKSIGLSLGFLYHEFFNFDTKSNFLKHLFIINDFNIGIANSELSGYQIIHKPNKALFSEINGASNHFIGDISLSLTYKFVNKPLFSAIGIHVGYQFYKSGIIRNPANQTLELSNGTSANLDFSGVYFGLNLTIGK
jgi:hypothetical protein